MLKKAKKKNAKNMDEEILKKIIDEMSSMEIEGPTGKKIKPDSMSVSVRSMPLKQKAGVAVTDEELERLDDPKGEHLDEFEEFKEDLEETDEGDSPIHEIPMEKIPGLEEEEDEIVEKDPWPGLKKELEELRAKVGKIEGMIGKGYYNE